MRKFLKDSAYWAIPLITITPIIPFLLPKLASQPSVNPPLVNSPSAVPVANLNTVPPTANNSAVLPDPILYQQQPAPSVSPSPLMTASSSSSTKNTETTPKTIPQKTPKTTVKTTTYPKVVPHSSPISQSVTKTISAPNYTTATPTQKSIDISVKIEENNGYTVGTSTPATLQDRNQKVLQTLSPNQALTVNATPSGLQLGKAILPSVVWITPSNGGYVYVADKWYRGKVLLVNEGNAVLAVNYVNLESYLYSVVGSEMHPTASIEALKSQAVAARSYALVHIFRPASQWYNIGDTQRWQVYSGIHKEYSSTHQAVNDTYGQVLMYNGGIVESLYASTDEIVRTVHKGRGMSQTGAYGLAEKGYNYQQILAYYYPGSQVMQIVKQ